MVMKGDAVRGGEAIYYLSRLPIVNRAISVRILQYPV